MKLYSTHNNIVVPSFILSGAPLTNKTGHGPQLFRAAHPRPADLVLEDGVVGQG